MHTNIHILFSCLEKGITQWKRRDNYKNMLSLPGLADNHYTKFLYFITISNRYYTKLLSNYCFTSCPRNPMTEPALFVRQGRSCNLSKRHVIN